VADPGSSADLAVLSSALLELAGEPVVAMRGL
jgi:hypothetical protein